VRAAKSSGRSGRSPAASRAMKTEKVLTPEEQAQLALKIQVAQDLGLWEKVQQLGWGGLTAAESGRVGGVMTRRRLEAQSAEPQ
jgi:small acid-soluble spore protein F (minor alpha/beta-type SASP)